jgi:hypothetical protein
MKHNQLRNKKGYSSTEVFGALIIMILVIIISIQTYDRFVKGGVKVLECKAQGGDCVAGTCSFPNQIPALSEKAAGCGRGELCCINITRTRPIDPLCMNAEGTTPLPIGTECDDNMYCDMAQVCVDKCEFCSKNVNNLQYSQKVKDICGIMSQEDKNKFTKGGIFGCSCTGVECAANRTKCVPNYCPGHDDATAPDYACCTK